MTGIVRGSRFRALKTFDRLLGSSAGISDDAEATRLCKLIMTPNRPDLERALDGSGIRPTPETTETVLAAIDNAGMLAYRFFRWARHHHRGGPLPTVRSYHLTIASLAKIRQYKLMWDLVAAMNADDLLDVETFCIVMRKYARAGKIDDAIYTFDAMEKFGVAQNIAAFNGLLSALCKSKSVPRAHRLFDEMRERFPPDAKTFSILIDGWGRQPNLVKMREVFDEMPEPDIVAYGIVVDRLCKVGRPEEAVEVIADMRRRGGLPPTPFLYTALIHAYGAANRMHDAVETFFEMERGGATPPDTAAYNSLISGFCRARRFPAVYRVLNEMRRRDVPSSPRTWNTIIKNQIAAGRTDEAYRAFRRMISGECEPDHDTYTMMVKMFCDLDRMEMAMKVWRYMRSKKLVVPGMHTFAVLIDGLLDNGEVEKACVFAEEMIEIGIRPPLPMFRKLKKLLTSAGRGDVVGFLAEKMKLLVQEPLCYI